jgi:hypothetical protein
VSTLRRSTALFVALFAAAGCTGDGGSTSTPTSTSAVPTETLTTPAVITPGEFRWANAGLVVTLELHTNVGTMVVDNGSDHDLPKPDVYVIMGTGEQIDGKVVDAAAVAQGETATFDVQFPHGVDQKSLGLVILLFGSDNYGAFAPA